MHHRMSAIYLDTVVLLTEMFKQNTMPDMDFTPYLQAEVPAAPATSAQLMPKVVRAGYSDIWRLPRETRQQLLYGRHTGGAFALSYTEVAQGKGPKTHFHEREDEMYLIDKGSFDFRLGDDTFQVGEGDFIFGPRGVLHGFTCTSEDGGGLYIWVASAGFEEFFREVAEKLEQGDFMPGETMRAIGRTYGLHFEEDPPPADKLALQRYMRGVATAPPKLIREGEAEVIEAFGDRGHSWISSREVGGRFCIGLGETPAQGGPPLHVHEREDETFLIVEGEYEFQIGDETFQVSVGDVVFAPHSIPHTFRVTSEGRGRAAMMVTPGGFDGFFREAAQMFASGANPADIVAMAGSYGIRFVEPS